jgi:crotonobetainyl-CoA:carnitine CoA-transferase CaiB-like acyl-CoA transferase
MARQALEGIRICDLTRFWAGPHCTSYLGALGAEVLKVEAIQNVDGFRWPQVRGDKWWEGSAQWCGSNINKYDVTLDLNQSEGVELFKRLVQESDVVIENFPPRVMENFDLAYPVLKGLKEDIIMVSMPGYGHTGPWRDYPAFAFSFEQTSGLASLTGYAGESPMNLGGAADPIAGIHAAFAVQAALEYRRRTGKGQFVELAQLEALTSFMGQPFLDYVMNQQLWERWGNRNPEMAPHNVYPCKDADTWVAVAVPSENDWQAFSAAIGNPEWARQEKFSTLSGRMENQDELDHHISQWTQQYEPYEVMDMLQGAGVPAGAVSDAQKLYEEPHLRERGFWAELDRPVVGKHPYSAFPGNFSETPMTYRAAPTLGQDNEYVLGTILGLSDAEIQALEEKRIIGTEPFQAGSPHGG